MSVTFFAVDDNDIVFLKRRWDDLLSSYASDQSIKDSSFQILKEMYSEKGRFYHNLGHVKALLQSLESLVSKIQEPTTIKFSIWFHDVVYNPERNDNEEESAKLASEIMAKLHVNTETIESVKDMILATKNHDANHLSEDAKLFLDMDLAILGMKEETYQEYSKAIREEYSWVSEPIYRTNRKKILKSFLDRNRIYFTDEMRKRFDEQARKILVMKSSHWDLKRKYLASKRTAKSATPALASGASVAVRALVCH